MTKKLTLAIDFDGTIVHNDYPRIGPLRPGARKAINTLYQKGHHIIIWTSRSGEMVEHARKFLIDNDIMFHSINQSNPEHVQEYGGDTRKIFADLYIDDRALFPLVNWDEIELRVSLHALRQYEQEI